MGSQNTTLSVVNFSGIDITKTDALDVLPHDWDYSTSAGRTKPWRPDLNFEGPLANLDSRCEREEINSAATDGVKFKLRFTLGGSTITFPVDQLEAEKKHAGTYTSATIPQALSHLEVYRETGQDENAYTQAFYIRTKQEPDNSNWMKQLLVAKPNVTLNKLTMPGSHDAGMYVDNGKKASLGGKQSGGGEWALTQNRNFSQQLAAGSRYFDVRVYYDNAGVLWAFHGEWHGEFYGSIGGKFEDILHDVATFMGRSGCEEAVFLKITPYVGADNYQATIDLVTQKLGTYLYKPPGSSTTNTNPQVDFATTKLADIKGKVIAAFTSPFKSLLLSSKGHYLYQDCGEDKTGNLLSARSWLTVYDVYSDTKSFDDMLTKQDDRLSSHGGYGKDYLFLYSWTLTGSGSLRDLELLSRAANPQLPKRLRELASGGKRPNIVYVDYIDPWICSAIIALND